jgi:hypothetical protein
MTSGGSGSLQDITIEALSSLNPFSSLLLLSMTQLEQPESDFQLLRLRATVAVHAGAGAGGARAKRPSLLLICSVKEDSPTAGRPREGGTTRGDPPFPRARRIGISVSRRTRVTEPVLRPPLRLGGESSSTNPRPLPPCQPRKDRAARATRAVTRQGHPNFSPVPTPGSTDTLLLRPPAQSSRRPDQTPPPPRGRASHAARRVREEEGR